MGSRCVRALAGRVGEEARKASPNPPRHALDSTMTNAAVLRAIYRYPVKGLSAEQLATAALRPRQTIAGDRRYAIENGASGFDPAAPAYLPKQRFLMLMKNARLARLRTRLVRRPTNWKFWRTAPSAHGVILAARPAAPPSNHLYVIRADELRGPPKVLAAAGHSFSDVAARWCRSSTSLPWRRSRSWSAVRSIRCGFAAIFTSRAGRPGASSISSTRSRDRPAGARQGRQAHRPWPPPMWTPQPACGSPHPADPDAGARPHGLRRLCRGNDGRRHRGRRCRFRCDGRLTHAGARDRRRRGGARNRPRGRAGRQRHDRGGSGAGTGTGTSSRNSEVIHAGIHYPTARCASVMRPFAADAL